VGKVIGKRYTLVLNFGYVESARLAYMPWTSKKTFKDAKEALLDLAAFLKEQYLVENEKPPLKCCAKTKANDTAAEYCSKCGRKMEDNQFDGELFSDWLCQLDTDIDTFHGLIEWNQEHRWQTGELEGAPNQRFVYQADWVLAAAVGHPKREDVTFETICKTRTKSRKDSFSYY
jgi:hypothetical protein